MLIKFSLENWMSFQKKASFSMVATRERQHGERVSRIPKYNIRALPVAAIYGKRIRQDQFFQGIEFCKDPGHQGHTARQPYSG